MNKVYKHLLGGLSLFFSLLNCAGCQSSFPSDYSLGILYSTEYNDRSKISYLDENLNGLTDIFYPYGYMGHDGYTNANIIDEVLYECPLGKATEKNLGLIIGLNMNSGEIAEYNINRTNITDFICCNAFIYATSNLNGRNYIDQYNKADGSICSLELEQYYVSELAFNDNVLYGFGVKLDNQDQGNIIHLFKFDFKSKQVKTLYNLSGYLDDSPSYSIIRQNMLYFAENGYLFAYDLKDNTLNQMALMHKNAFNLLCDGDILYIGCTDIFTEAKSWIDVIDLKTNKQIASYPINHSILQMEISGNYIYVSDYNTITKYYMIDNQLKESGKITLEPEENYYVGGFFVREEK